MCGLPGAGKTTLSKRLEEERKAIRLCPDEWIIALKGDQSIEDADTRIRELLQQKFLRHAIKIAQAGVDVILENGFWPRAERDEYRDAIKKAGLKVELHFLDAPLELLWERVNKRNNGEYAFKVDSQNLEKWHNAFEKPTDEEGKTYDQFVKY